MTVNRSVIGWNAPLGIFVVSGKAKYDAHQLDARIDTEPGRLRLNDGAKQD
jgi:hypothetical protein